VLAWLDEIWNSGNPVISTQVLQELVVCLPKKVARLLDATEIRKIVAELQDWKVVNDSESVLRALELEVRYKISF
jgi:predicted nucleic acid-binding protein